METMVQQRQCQGCQECPARVVCRCLQITEDTVVTAITTLGLRTVKELKTVTGAGDGCTCCHQNLRQLIERHAQSPSSPEPICS